MALQLLFPLFHNVTDFIVVLHQHHHHHHTHTHTHAHAHTHTHAHAHTYTHARAQQKSPNETLSGVNGFIPIRRARPSDSKAGTSGTAQ